MNTGNKFDRPALVRERLDKPLVLIGMMGSGKSHIGKLLGEALDLPFVDSDTEIERQAGLPIAKIFSRDGEPAFRKMERKIVQDLLGNGLQVIATGGGAVMNPETAQAIWEGGLSVWIHADPVILAERAGNPQDRPLLACGNPVEILETLLKERNPVYEKADITVCSDELSVADTVGAVIEALYSHLYKEP